MSYSSPYKKKNSYGRRSTPPPPAPPSSASSQQQQQARRASMGRYDSLTPPLQLQQQQYQPPSPAAVQQQQMQSPPSGSVDPHHISDDGAKAIVRNIASFLTLSDATSMVSIVLPPPSADHQQHQHYEYATNSAVLSDCDSWAVGEELLIEQQSVTTPATPALMAISPGATPCFDLTDARQIQQQQQQQDDHHRHHDPDHPDHHDDNDDDDDSVEDELDLEELLQERKRRWAQERLAAAVFAHPQSIRTYCVEAYTAASEIRQLKEAPPGREEYQQQQQQQEEEDPPETHREPPTCSSNNNRALVASQHRRGGGGQRQQQQQQRRHHHHQHHHHQKHKSVQPYRSRHHHRRKDFVFVHDLVDSVLHNVPLSVLMDLSQCAVETYFESVSCTIKISATSLSNLIQTLSHTIQQVWDGVTNFNPFAVLDAIISLQVNAMGKTSEVLASGIQSVATGVGSASSLALHRLSRTGVGSTLSVHRTGSSSGSLVMGAFNQGSFGVHGGMRTKSAAHFALQQKKLIRKVSAINSAAEVISYMELEDDTGGLSKTAKNRVQRMMHYDVSLRPFVATIAMPPPPALKLPPQLSLPPRTPPQTPATATTRQQQQQQQQLQLQQQQQLQQRGGGGGGRRRSSSSMGGGIANADGNINNSSNNFDNIEFAGQPENQHRRKGDGANSNGGCSSSEEESSPMDSPFMCTPQSFPPTPASRTTVLARSTRFADDVVFLARDKIRVHDALNAENERTREMARALSEGKRLAVFDAKDAGNGIELTCGQHLATKVGNLLYCSTRSMVPILRNCYVYFEMTVMPRPIQMMDPMQATLVTLSIGLSTEEMPPNTLVGAWSGSVGLCTTGQILTAGQWCTPGDPSLSCYGDSATVGCLVCLDDGSAFETWDGVMITAQVTFNVNGRIVAPPVSTLPTTGGASGLLPGAQMQMGLINGSIGYDPLPYRGPNPMPPRSTLPLLVPSAEELYPTVTLHSPASAVMCRFSAEDIVANSRESIGAPEGRTIYAVDGSVIRLGAGEDV